MTSSCHVISPLYKSKSSAKNTSFAKIHFSAHIATKRSCFHPSLAVFCHDDVIGTWSARGVQRSQNASKACIVLRCVDKWQSLKSNFKKRCRVLLIFATFFFNNAVTFGSNIFSNHPLGGRYGSIYTDYYIFWNLLLFILQHCFKGISAYIPILIRLGCGFFPDDPRGHWEGDGYGLLGVYKSDWDRFGGFTNHRKGWGGEDWDLIDNVVEKGLEMERLRTPYVYHYHHNKKGMWHTWDMQQSCTRKFV